MKNCSGIILSPGNNEDFGPLVKTRPDYMIPFGARYRIIDFCLSNMANFNVSHVMLYAGSNIRSTIDHISDGSDWELNRRSNGLLINPRVENSQTGKHSDVETFFGSLPFYENMAHENLYIENPMAISKVNLQEAYNTFIEGDYDILILYSEENDKDGRYNGMNKLILDENGRLINIGYNLGTNPKIELQIGRYFIKNKVFIDLVKDAMEKGNANNLIQAVLNNKTRLKIGTYKVESKLFYIHDIDSYYHANMALLDAESYREVFHKNGMVYTKSKDEPSTLYTETAKMSNSLVANGCIIEGEVENSVLFRGVHIHKNAIIRNCIINQGTEIEENAVCVNTITDKNALVGSGVTVAGSANNPYMIGKDQVITNPGLV